MTKSTMSQRHSFHACVLLRLSVLSVLLVAPTAAFFAHQVQQPQQQRQWHQHGQSRHQRLQHLASATIDVDAISASSTSSSTSAASSSSSSSNNNGSNNGRTNNNNSNEDDDTNDIGTIGNWKNLHGNWILAPTKNSNTDDEGPRAVIHFLGGALVGNSPHITYRYLLERLADQGYLIVATPYQLSFDHLSTCDEIIHKFEQAAPTIARKYGGGALPVVGMGHSCGALLQLLINSVFPDTPRAANALISFNNKPIQDAVPFFDEVFAPFFTAIASENGALPSGNTALELSLQVARSANRGELPSDAVVNDILRKLVVPPALMSLLDRGSGDNGGVVIPQELRNAVASLTSPPQQVLKDVGVVPFMDELIGSLEQIPRLVEEVADGANDFIPTPASVKNAARRAYRARRTLILGYEDDPIDESNEVETLLVEARSVTRMKRPMIQIDVERKELKGNHATPLLAPPLELAGRAEDLLGQDEAKERLLYEQADATVEELTKWLEAGNL